jgi:hypothetical protein
LALRWSSFGIAVSAWLLVGDTYDDRLEDRSVDRVRRIRWRYDPITADERAPGIRRGVGGRDRRGVWSLVSGPGV